MLNEVVPHEELMPAARAKAAEMAFWPPMASRAAKRVLQRNLNATLEEGLRNEIVSISHATRAPHDVEESRALVRRKAQAGVHGRVDGAAGEGGAAHEATRFDAGSGNYRYVLEQRTLTELQAGGAVLMDLTYEDMGVQGRQTWQITAAAALQ